MPAILPKIESPRDLQGLSLAELTQLAGEMREALCIVMSHRTAHFASNLGVVELCLALHTMFDFSRDRLIWDTGHQIYPHKLITGRYRDFNTIRTKGGLMGYPNPRESDYDLFMTGHAGCSVSTVLGLRSGDELLGEKDRHAVAVIGDGALPSGIVFEALNNSGGPKKKLLVILNDNQMSICPRVGSVADYLDQLRTNRIYTGLKHEVVELLKKLPLVGAPAERMLAKVKETIKIGLHGGMLFESLGFRYFGPVDGHSIPHLRKYLKMVKDAEGPVLLHVVTEKGHGFKPASDDPVFFHTPAPFEREEEAIVSIAASKSRSYTDAASEAIGQQMRTNPRVTVLTAAMCQGNKLEAVRAEFPDRFFDTAICESHTVAFAAGQAKAGVRPIVDIYSTFLQRSFDQVFQEVALQNLPVTFMLDRAGLTGPDGPTHHGVFDLGYMRLFPNLVVMAPGDEDDLAKMLEFALAHDAPVSIRYPKATVEEMANRRTPIELGRAEALHWGSDGTIIACGTLLGNCLKAAATLREEGLDFGVVNARFVKPLDTATMLRAIETSPAVLTVEEGALAGGFGSAVLEAVAEAGISAAHVRRLGIPDRFIEHGERGELLADLGLDAAGIAQSCRSLVDEAGAFKNAAQRRVS
ncbi:MAG TPA: 1-deoxy-D-xylulose-5-phosphate synthase [Pirellulales bacterium]|jgi:1-deoxy-D-xylulose-5-phosphate synthase|nr:1-deoxy-D-xylulose-5-phosphate synthase [Pirellulales bacterium]